MEYVSDFNNSVVDVYAGAFASQNPCGEISSGLNRPAGLFVNALTHDLYVANTNDFDILVFHRGETTPYDVYTDPGVQYPLDVTVAKDGTVIASNRTNASLTEAGSISTWLPGAAGGTFVGNFPMRHSSGGAFVVARKDGMIFYNDFDARTNAGALWSVNCPAGACGIESRHTAPPGIVAGLGFDDSGDLLANDQLNAAADTFELPNPNPSMFPLTNGAVGLAFDHLRHHWFITEIVHNTADEYSYPDGRLIGTVFGGRFPSPNGIAVDP